MEFVRYVVIIIMNKRPMIVIRKNVKHSPVIDILIHFYPDRKILVLFFSVRQGEGIGKREAFNFT